MNIYLIGVEYHSHAPGARWAPTHDTEIDEVEGYFTDRAKAQERADERNVERHGTKTPVMDPTKFPDSMTVVVEVEPA